MTIEEKIAQLQCEVKEVEGKNIITEKGIGELGPILRPLGPKEAAEKANRIQKFVMKNTRLGIPIIFHDEGLHGLCAKGATSFPQAIGLAATWNPELLGKVAVVIGKETRSRGIRQLLSPVVNIARDVRWGRVEETYGEDPYLTSVMGVAFCKGVRNEGVITTPKHFAANVGDGGRDSNIVHFSERLLREIYFPAFKSCVQEGKAESIMAAYNSLDGIPCSANKWLLTDILRGEWGFKGFVVSDYGSVAGIMYHHHTADTGKETARQTVESGLDIELPNIEFYGEPLLQAVKEGLVSESTINQAVSRVLLAKFNLGLFENPYVDPEFAAKVNDCKEHRELALQAALEAIVLLKNEGNILPLDKNIKSIAVIGPNADTVQLGGYSGFGMKAVTVLEGIKNKVSKGTKINYVKGGIIKFTDSLTVIPSKYFIPSDGMKKQHGLKGEYFNNMYLSGKPALVRVDNQINFDWGEGSPDKSIHPDKFSIRWTGKLIPSVSRVYKLGVTTDDGVRLFLDGKLLIDKWYDRGATTDEVSIQLKAGQQYDIKIEYYENKVVAVANLEWDLLPSVTPAIEAAKKSDVAIVVTGIIEGEGKDRSNLNLSSQQENLIKAVYETGTPTIVVLINGSAITMDNWIAKVGAIVEAWYLGEEGGNAIADVLFGNYNPGGRLPITFPQSVGQLPLYYNYKPTGRGYDYIDLSGRPLFPFGYGLSYTKFEYSNLRLIPENMLPDKEVKVSVDVKNVGSFKGDEVVQLYIHRLVASVSRPLKELKGFKRITLAAGEKKTVTLTLKPDQLSFLDRKMKYVIEPGDWEIMVGSSSEDIRLKTILSYLGK
jgi:beta-glucosidase